MTAATAVTPRVPGPAAACCQCWPASTSSGKAMTSAQHACRSRRGIGTVMTDPPRPQGRMSCRARRGPTGGWPGPIRRRVRAPFATALLQPEDGAPSAGTPKQRCHPACPCQVTRPLCHRPRAKPGIASADGVLTISASDRVASSALSITAMDAARLPFIVVTSRWFASLYRQPASGRPRSAGMSVSRHPAACASVRTTCEFIAWPIRGQGSLSFMMFPDDGVGAPAWSGLPPVGLELAKGVADQGMGLVGGKRRHPFAKAERRQSPGSSKENMNMRRAGAAGPVGGMLDQQCGDLERIDDPPAGEGADQLILLMQSRGWEGEGQIGEQRLGLDRQFCVDRLHQDTRVGQPVIGPRRQQHLGACGGQRPWRRVGWRTNGQFGSGKSRRAVQVAAKAGAQAAIHDTGRIAIGVIAGQYQPAMRLEGGEATARQNDIDRHRQQVTAGQAAAHQHDVDRLIGREPFDLAAEHGCGDTGQRHDDRLGVVQNAVGGHTAARNQDGHLGLAEPGGDIVKKHVRERVHGGSQEIHCGSEA
ncbi:hypothetical protein WR25_05443 [Diploscapter pachys]|uniref:Uncharacterized protein n=1 Tax=Diploscapter pachys TaxID=2018661 RepID=A0A2A2JWR9_9BILA|nr:hypothetical protein WR25_05443 [Diploscapter pachys]